MDIIENWNLLYSRIKYENSELVTSLCQIHMGVFDDIRKSGHMLKVNDKPVSELAPTIQPEQRLILAGVIGRNLIDAQGDLFNKRFLIKLADYFPNCIFIALAAILENLDGGLNVMFPGKKISVACEYETVSGNNDPLGKALPLIEKCYPWVALSIEARQTKPPASKPPRFIPKDKTSLIFAADQITPVDTMRTAFGGTIQRGTIQKGDVLNVIDGSGKVLCHEGIVLLIYANGQELNKAGENQHLDELGLAVEIPAGSYSGIFLVDGDKMLASPNQRNHTDNSKSANKS